MTKITSDTQSRIFALCPAHGITAAVNPRGRGDEASDLSASRPSQVPPDLQSVTGEVVRTGVRSLIGPPRPRIAGSAATG